MCRLCVCFRTSFKVLHESFWTIWVTLALRHISNQLPPLHPVPTDDPSPPKSLGLLLTHLRGTCPGQLAPLRIPSQGQTLAVGRGWRKHKDWGTLKTCRTWVETQQQLNIGPKALALRAANHSGGGGTIQGQSLAQTAPSSCPPRLPLCLDPQPSHVINIHHSLSPVHPSPGCTLKLLQ